MTITQYATIAEMRGLNRFALCRILAQMQREEMRIENRYHAGRVSLESANDAQVELEVRTGEAISKMAFRESEHVVIQGALA